MKLKAINIYKVSGSKLRLARVSKGWTLDEFALRANVNRKTIGEIENEKREVIRIKTLEKLAKAIGTKVENFYEEDEEL